MEKYDVKDNGYINKETDEWRFVETVELPELNVAKLDKALRGEALMDFDLKWLLSA